jgi:ParB family chromosome partitioning protein
MATRVVTQPIDITLIDPDPDQPRKFPAPFTPDEPGARVMELADSIRSSGLLQPIVVYRHEGRFRVLVGERRWRAFRLLAASEPGEWGHIPAIEWSGPNTPVTLLAMRIIENDHREDASPSERRTAYLQLREYCGGNASQAIRLLGIGRVTWYRVTGDTDPDLTHAAIAPRPKAASRLSMGQLTRALETFDDDRLDKLNESQARDLATQLERILNRLRQTRVASTT